MKSRWPFIGQESRVRRIVCAPASTPLNLCRGPCKRIFAVRSRQARKLIVEKLIRWGFCGTGAIGRSAAEDLRLVTGTLLHGVASRRIERAMSFAAEHGISRFYPDLQALLDDPEIDVVYIASPNHCHLDDSLSCIQAGKAVLCEKPFTLDLDQGQRIVDAARQRKVFCMEAMWTG